MRLTRQRSCNSVFKRAMEEDTANIAANTADTMAVTDNNDRPVDTLNEESLPNSPNSPTKPRREETDSSEIDRGRESSTNHGTPLFKKQQRMLPTPFTTNNNNNNNRQIDFLQKTITTLQTLMKTQSNQINGLLEDNREKSQLNHQLVEKLTCTDKVDTTTLHLQQAVQQHASMISKLENTCTSQLNQIKVHTQQQQAYQQKIGFLEQNLMEKDRQITQHIHTMKILQAEKMTLESNNKKLVHQCTQQQQIPTPIPPIVQAQQLPIQIPTPPIPPIVQVQQPQTQLTQPSYAAAAQATLASNSQQTASQPPRQQQQQLNLQRQRSGSSPQQQQRARHLQHAQQGGLMKSRIFTDSTCAKFKQREVAARLDESQETVRINKFPNAESHEMLHYLKYYLEKDKPDNLIIVTGANDLLHHKDRYHADARQIAESMMALGKEAKKHGVWRTCIAGIIRPKYENCKAKVDEVNELIKEMCHKEGIQFIDQSNITNRDLGDMIHVGQHSMNKLLNNIGKHLHTYRENRNEDDGRDWG